MADRYTRQRRNRAAEASLDIVNCQAGRNALKRTLLSPLANERSDAHGGPLRSRAVLLREPIDETRENASGRTEVVEPLAICNCLGPTCTVDAAFRERRYLSHARCRQRT